ncbi:MAG: clostripain-related cysteine peptidase [Muribaculum sp.]|nr:clostripain-related cysteine peptidase [Muribaculaceae bacterium]MCM1080636.1 clostripain-related cysteine peptidase [Muribaculum sp.]
MKKFILYLLLFITLITFNSCGGDDHDSSCHRTVLVYIADKNNLSNYANGDINEMKRGVLNGALNGGRLLIFQARGNNGPTLSEMDSDGELKLLKQYGSDMLSVDPASFQLVFNDMQQLAPNREYGLVLWSHSSGWLSHPPTESEPLNAVEYSWGDDRGRTMTIPQLKEALAGQRFCFIYFDSCFMGNVEALYELRTAAPVFVASPTEVLGEGMPYAQNVACFFSKGKPDMVQAAKNTFNYYNSQYGSDRSCTIAVYNTDVFEDLANLSNRILQYNHTTPAGAEYTQYGYEIKGAYFNGYFYDMYQYLSSLCEVNSALTTELNNVWERLITYQAHTPLFWAQFSLEGTHGLSCFIYPDHKILGQKYGYTDLEWFTTVVAPALNDTK